MQQMNFLKEQNPEIYLYGEVEKLKNSTDRRCRAIFALLTEMQDQILKMQMEEENISRGK